jgi:hypothetical protein
VLKFPNIEQTPPRFRAVTIMIRRTEHQEDNKVSFPQLMEQWGTPLRWRCNDAQLVLEAGANSRDRIAFNLEMSPSGWLSVDGHKIETAVAQIYCGDSSYAEAQAKKKVTGKLTLIEREVFAEIVLSMEKFQALQSMIAYGAKPVDFVVHVRDLQSDGYGTGNWDKSAAERGPGISNCSLTCLVPNPIPAESDARVSEILDTIHKIENRTAEWTKVFPWVIGLLCIIAGILLIKKW